MRLELSSFQITQLINRNNAITGVQMSDLTICLLEWAYLFLYCHDQLFFSHSVNCSDRVSAKIDHGSVNRPPILPAHIIAEQGS